MKKMMKKPANRNCRNSLVICCYRIPIFAGKHAITVLFHIDIRVALSSKLKVKSYDEGAIDMQDIILDEEFRTLMPALDEETFKLLEESVLKNGVEMPLVLWNGILIDGYNRYRICMEHDVPYTTIDKEFEVREEVLIWIITNQVARRNLTPLQLSRYRGLHYRAEKKVVSNRKGRNQHSEVEFQNETQPTSTATRLAKRYNVSRSTIIRDSKAARAIEVIGEISPEAKVKILSGEILINKKELEVLSSGSKEEIEALAVKIEEGVYERVTPKAALPVDDVGDSGFDVVRQLSAAVKDRTEGFHAVLQSLDGDDKEGMQTALRSLIDALEEFYKTL